MTSAVRKLEPVTIAEFDDYVEGHGDDARSYELVDGVIVMMTNPTENHEQIAGNIGARLKFAMDKRGCRAYQGGMRVQRNANKKAKDKPKPDVMVRCGPTDAARGRRNFVDDPVVVVEVLSPSTMDHDRGPKLEFYKSLEPLRHIVIVYQDQMRIEHYRRGDDGWTAETLTRPADVLELTAVDFTMPLADAYFDVSIA